VKVAFVFPGQRAEAAAAGPAWQASSPETRRLLAEAARHVGIAAEKLFAGGGRALERTDVQQPVLTALSLGVHAELLGRGVRPDVVTGHSLGEIAACAAAGCLSPEEAVALAAVRGRLMAREAAGHPGGMLALTTPDQSVVEEALGVARSHGIAALAAHNTAAQWVISGELSALRAVAARFPATPVPVTGPWHTDVMRGAEAEFLGAARAAIRRPPAIALVCNRDGSVVSRAEDLPALLAGQLTHAVEWVATMRTLAAAGVAHVVVVGPAKAMRSLVRQNLGDAVTIHATDLPEDLDRIGEALAR
jgi:[acyl-carrier-protein] S-malonyltransferase